MKLLAPRLGLLILLPVLAGCGQKPGQVSGKVTYKGQPVPAGWVTFRPADPGQNAVTVDLNEDGTFLVELPAGEVTVVVDNREWEPRPAAGGGIPSVPPALPIPGDVRAKLASAPAAAPPAKAEGEGRTGGRSGRYVRLPERYLDLGTTPLKFTVKGGPQTEDLELVD